MRSADRESGTSRNSSARILSGSENSARSTFSSRNCRKRSSFLAYPVITHTHYM